MNTLTHRASTIAGYNITLSLEAQTVTDTEGYKGTFDIDPFRKYDACSTGLTTSD